MKNDSERRRSVSLSLDSIYNNAISNTVTSRLNSYYLQKKTMHLNINLKLLVVEVLYMFKIGLFWNQCIPM